MTQKFIHNQIIINEKISNIVSFYFNLKIKNFCDTKKTQKKQIPKELYKNDEHPLNKNGNNFGYLFNIHIV